jgi:hypothetical protein
MPEDGGVCGVVRALKEWAQTTQDKDKLREIRDLMNDRLHQLEHDDPHGAGGGTRAAGYKPLKVEGARRQP